MTPRLVDVHTHTNFNAFKEDGDEITQRALDAGIGMILVGSQINTSRRAVEYAGKYDEGVWATVGLHPIHLEEEFNYEAYKELALHPKTVAIGECGLDYYRMEKTEEIVGKQKETLRQQISLAREAKKPLMIHCRNAYDNMLQILREEKADKIGGNIHFFAGNWEIAQKFLDLGFYLSFTGVVTFARDYDEVVKNIPLDRIMTETDAPYVTPVPHRGKRNEPMYVEEVAKKIAQIKNLPLELVFEATAKNAERLFNLTF